MSKDDDPSFADLIGGVKRLQNDRADLYQQRPPAAIKAKSANRASALQADDLTPRSVPQNAYYKTGLQKKLQHKIRQGLIRPQARLDLHGYRQQQATAELASFLQKALDNQLRMVLIIHGQGYRSEDEAVLRPLTQSWLAEQPEVLAWCPAQPSDGSNGASYVYLASAGN